MDRRRRCSRTRIRPSCCNGNVRLAHGRTDGPPVADEPDVAEIYQLELWLNPHGFLKAAAMPGANPIAMWRWELGEMGRDGPTAVPEKVNVVSITVLGKYRMDATINKEHMLQRIHTWVPEPGARGSELRARVHQRELHRHRQRHQVPHRLALPRGVGRQLPGQTSAPATTRSAAVEGREGERVPRRRSRCRNAVRKAHVSGRVDATKLADGVYLLGGASHNSVAVEFQRVHRRLRGAARRGSATWR